MVHLGNSKNIAYLIVEKLRFLVEALICGNTAPWVGESGADRFSG